MQSWRQWESAPDSDWGTALEREAVIRPIAEGRKLGKAVVEEAGKHLGLSRALIYRLVSRYRQRPKTSSLLPWKRGPARNTRCLDVSREDLLTACIKEFYLVPEQPSIAALFQEVRRRFADRQLPAVVPAGQPAARVDPAADRHPRVAPVDRVRPRRPGLRRV